jgi:hypothetical protein
MTTQGTEARRGETVGLDAKRDGPVGAADAPQPTDNPETIMTDVQQAVPVAQEKRDDIRRSIIRQLGDDPYADRIILAGTEWDIVLEALRTDATQTREAEGLQEITEDELREAIQKSIDHPGMTQNLFARETGISKSHLSEFLSGKRRAEPAIAGPCGYRWALVHDTRATDDLTDAALNARDVA